MSLTTPLAAPAVAAPARSRRAGLGAALLSVDAALLVGLTVVGLFLRLPYLWSIPRFTDETREALRAIELLHGGLPVAEALVNVDGYIGGLYVWLLTGLFWLSGVSALTPRLVTAVAGTAAVGITYLLARDLGGRLAGLLAAALLATSGAQILANSHIAWSHCLTPTLTTLAAWLLQRAIRDGRPVAWLGSGFAFGLALQTHPATLVLLPGAALYALWWGRRWLRTPWPYLALGLFLVGFANVLLYNLLTAGGSFRAAATIQERYDRDIVRDVVVYLSTHATHGVMLLRYLAGAVDSRESPAAYLLDPTLWLYGGLALAGLIFCARRGAPLLLLLTLSSILVMPYFNLRKYVPISDGRYLMPLLPLAYAAIGALLAAGWHRLAERGPGDSARSRRGWRVAIAAGALLLVLSPLAPLSRYYGQELAAGRTNGPLLQAVDAVSAVRQRDEPVLLDRDLADVKLEGGGTAFRALRFLLAGVGIDDRSVDSVADYARKMRPGTSALLITDATAFQRVPTDPELLGVLGVQARPVVAPPAPDGYGAYRLERIASAAGVPPSSASLGRTGLPAYAAISRDDPLGGSDDARADPGGADVVAAASDPTDARQASPKAQVPIEVFAAGLVNPRGLAFRSDGSLFVALAGNGGPDLVDVGREKPHRYGRTGQVLRITPTGDKFQMAKNLPSIVTAVNEECGPSAIAFVDDRTYLLMASGGWEIGDPAFHSGVYELLSDGSLRLVWDMTAYVLEHPARARREDPRADVPAGMAYGMAALDGKLYVTDANQEQLFEVDPATGSARQVVEYPKSNRAMTGVAAGPDGALYVAEWASSKITRITLDGTISDAATKLRVPVGVTFGPDGAMYVVEFTGRVLRAAPVGEEQKDILAEGLRAATAITFGPDGNLYVSEHGQGAAQGEGQILRLRLAPPDPGLERARWANGAAWAAGLLVFVALLALGWRFRQRAAPAGRARP
jgi:4-amino-4-deoxy-L-arabinose transferase-like glycosyltransferase/glucose/arabinose dehydrogenase